MMHRLRHYSSVFACYLRLTVQVQCEYPTFLISWLLMIPLQYLGTVALLATITERFGGLGGWGPERIAFLYGLALLSHGLQVVFFIRAWGIDQALREGEFDRHLVRPLPVLFGFLASYVNLIGCIDLIPAGLILAWAAPRVGITFDTWTVLGLIMVVIASTLLRAGLYLAVGSLAFWTRRSRELVGTLINLSDRGSQWPMHIYPHAVQSLLTFVLPLAFVSFYPACALFGPPDGITYPGFLGLWWTLPVGVACFLFGVLVFQRGLARYDSPGS